MSRVLVLNLATSIVLLGLLCQQASADEPAILTTPIPHTQAVDIDGDTAVATNGGYSSFPQQAYVFVKPEGGWTDMSVSALLVPPRANDRAAFGASAAVDGDVIVVGMPRWRGGCAFVYVKPPGGWESADVHYPTVTLVHTPDYEYDPGNFGRTVSISGDTIVVGNPTAYGRYAWNGGRGALYVFEKPDEGWTSESGYLLPRATLTASDNVAYIGIGMSLAMDGDTVISGGSGGYDPSTGETAASAYVFEKPVSGWTDMNETASLSYAVWAPGRAGRAVAIEGDTVVFGTWQRNEAAAFVRPAGGWADMTESAILTPGLFEPDVGTQEFGYSLLVDGDTILVGAPWKHTLASSVFLFDKPAGGWSGVVPAQDRLGDPDGNLSSSFGTLLASDGTALVVGAVWPAYGLYVYSSVLNAAPVPVADFSSRVIAGETVRFNGSGSWDPDGWITHDVWDFGDGQSATGEIVQHTFASPGTHWVTLTVTDDHGTSVSTPPRPITVISMYTAIQDLRDLIASYGLRKGVEGPMDRILTDAQSLLQKGNDTACADKVSTFLRKVEAERGDDLTDAQADMLVHLGQRVLSVL